MTIYFIRNVDCGRIKIGFTDAATPDSRVASMRTGNPSELEVAAYCPGEQSREHALHQALSADRVRGEWFHPSARMASLLAYVERFNTTDGWEESERNPKFWAQHVLKFGSPIGFSLYEPLSDSEFRWQRALAENSHKPRPFVKKGEVVWEFDAREWEGSEPVVEHEIHPYPNYATEVRWVNRHGSRERGDELFSGKGETMAAELVALAHTPEESAIAWTAACVQTLLDPRRFGELDAERRFPDVRELERVLTRKLGTWWHYACSSVLPLHFSIPNICTLTASEFVSLCALHRHRASRRFGVRVRWAQGVAHRIDARSSRVAA